MSREAELSKWDALPIASWLGFRMFEASFLLPGSKPSSRPMVVKGWALRNDEDCPGLMVHIGIGTDERVAGNGVVVKTPRWYKGLYSISHVRSGFRVIRQSFSDQTVALVCARVMGKLAAKQGLSWDIESTKISGDQGEKLKGITQRVDMIQSLTADRYLKLLNG